MKSPRWIPSSPIGAYKESGRLRLLGRALDSTSFRPIDGSAVSTADVGMALLVSELAAGLVGHVRATKRLALLGTLNRLWSEREGPVRLFAGIRGVVPKAVLSRIPVDDLVKGQVTGQRTRCADMRVELVGEDLHQTLHQEALTGRESALLSVGGAPGSHQYQLDVRGESAQLDLIQASRDLAGAELAGRTLSAGLHPEEAGVEVRRAHHVTLSRRTPRNPPPPSPTPTCRIESKSSGVSSCSGRMTVFEAPGKMALTDLRSVGPPAHSSTKERRGVPSGNSNTPSRRMSPHTVKTMVPGEDSVPFVRSQSGPSARIQGTLANVSTLFTRVGLSFGGAANSPSMNGRAIRGSGGRRSMTSSRPVSSPNR